MALRYRASLQTKQKLVHKFFDELEVEASGVGLRLVRLPTHCVMRAAQSVQHTTSWRCFQPVTACKEEEMQAAKPLLLVEPPLYPCPSAQVVARCGRITDQWGEPVQEWIDTAELVLQAGLEQV